MDQTPENVFRKPWSCIKMVLIFFFMEFPGRVVLGFYYCLIDPLRRNFLVFFEEDEMFWTEIFCRYWLKTLSTLLLESMDSLTSGSTISKEEFYPFSKKYYEYLDKLVCNGNVDIELETEASATGVSKAKWVKLYIDRKAFEVAGDKFRASTAELLSTVQIVSALMLTMNFGAFVLGSDIFLALNDSPNSSCQVNSQGKENGYKVLAVNKAFAFCSGLAMLMSFLVIIFFFRLKLELVWSLDKPSILFFMRYHAKNVREMNLAFVLSVVFTTLAAMFAGWATWFKISPIEYAVTFGTTLLMFTTYWLHICGSGYDGYYQRQLKQHFGAEFQEKLGDIVTKFKKRKTDGKDIQNAQDAILKDLKGLWSEIGQEKGGEWKYGVALREILREWLIKTQSELPPSKLVSKKTQTSISTEAYSADSSGGTSESREDVV